MEKNEKRKPLVVESEIKRVFKEVGLNKEEAFASALNEKVRKDLEEAIRRAKMNGRKTVMVRDI